MRLNSVSRYLIIAVIINAKTISILDFYVDVKDTARLHLAALFHPDIHNKRIFAYAGPYTWHMIQTAMKGIYPGKEFSPDIAEAGLDRSEIVLAPKAEGYLKEMGYKGWTTLEESVKMNTQDLV